MADKSEQLAGIKRLRIPKNPKAGLGRALGDLALQQGLANLSGKQPVILPPNVKWFPNPTNVQPTLDTRTQPLYNPAITQKFIQYAFKRPTVATMKMAKK